MNIQNFVENYHTLPASERKEGLAEIIKGEKLQTVFNLVRGSSARAACV